MENKTPKTFPQPLILAVYPDVETNVPQQVHKKGVFIVGIESGYFFFKWNQYIDNTPQLHRPSPTNANNSNNSNKPSESNVKSTDDYSIPYFHQIYIISSRIQKLIIAPQETSSDILISTFHPPEMLQFQFYSNPITSCLQLLQLLAVNSAILKNPPSTPDFWPITLSNTANTFPIFDKLARVFDVPCIDGLFQVPYLQVFTSFDSIPYVDEIANQETSAKFGVQGGIFTDFPLDQEFYEHCLMSSVNFSELRVQASRRGISPSMRYILWPQLLSVLPFKSDTQHFIDIRTKEYQALKQQWTLLSPYQLSKRPELRSAYQTIRMDVRRTNIPPDSNVDQIRKLLSNILKTYAVWCFDVRYTQGLNDILLPFIIIFERSPYSEEVREALSFWCFAAFIEQIDSALIENNMDGVLNEDLPFVFQLLKKYDVNCAKWFEQCEMSDLSFLVSSYILAFRRSLSQNDIERAWDSVLASNYPAHFIPCLAVSLLLFAFPACSKIENCSTPLLLPVCDKILANQPIGSVIGVAIQIAGNEQPREKRIKTKVRQLFSTNFFTPYMAEEYQQCVSAHLFV